MGTQESDAPTQTPVQRDASTEAFEFVRELAMELSSSTIELPSFPDVAMRVQKVLTDESVSSERIVRVIGAEPMIATRVLSLANSAALNPGSRPVTELKAAVTRLGLDALRSAVIGFAMAQLRRAKSFKGIERHLSALWQHSVQVAALSFVIARRGTRISPDTTMLCGLVHGVGKLYILTHSMRHPALFADQVMYQRIIRDWHANIAKALLESWGVAEEIVDAVHSYEDEARDLRGTSAMLADVLELAEQLALCKDAPDLMRERLRERKSALRLGLDEETARKLVAESSEELVALREALGN
ncbi:MAG TPA: HDOD domain-containing protein [Steroidobacteraceae bacterium]|jgi:HD-like signal output (HDOD) protein|nr:HDOD domain-containing protein [Steroidobacteraceae bacterium]